MYLDQAIIDGFKAEAIAQMGDAIEFAVNATKSADKAADDELRQAAQDALIELMTPIVGAMNEAYIRSYKPDPEAVAHIFTRMATRARLMSLVRRDDQNSQFPTVRVHTRKGDVIGELYGVITRDGEEVAHLSNRPEDRFIPVVSIIDVEEVDSTS